MKEKALYITWGLLFIICVPLGFVNNAEGFGKFLLNATSFIFFLPGAILLYDAYKKGDRKGIRRVRIISIVSLSLTLLVLICNFLSVSASEKTGVFLYELLGVVSVPMFCAPNWLVSLFLWACLFSASFKLRGVKPR
jgi:hypothetical protein